MNAKNDKSKVDALVIGDLAKKAKLKDKNVINATVGSFYYDDGVFRGLKTVNKIINSLPDDEKFTYSVSSGGEQFENSILNYIFEGSFNFFKSQTHMKVVATPGGTGAVFESLFNNLKVNEQVVFPDLCWEPYFTMCKVNNFVANTFNYIDGNKFDLCSFENSINKVVQSQNKLVVLINDPCNNPTGYTLSVSEFSQMIDLLNKTNKEIVFIYDIAYFDYDLNKDDLIYKLKILASQQDNFTTHICFSGSKSFSAYGMRLGAHIIMNRNESLVSSQYELAKIIARTHWSNIPKVCISFMNALCNKDELLQDIKQEQAIIRNTLLSRITKFKEEADIIGLKYYPVNSGFFIAVECLDSIKVFQELIKDKIYVIPFNKAIRIAICSVPLSEVEGLATRISLCIKRVEGI